MARAIRHASLVLKAVDTVVTLIVVCVVAMVVQHELVAGAAVVVEVSWILEEHVTFTRRHANWWQLKLKHRLLLKLLQLKHQQAATQRARMVLRNLDTVVISTVVHVVVTGALLDQVAMPIVAQEESVPQEELAISINRHV